MQVAENGQRPGRPRPTFSAPDRERAAVPLQVPGHGAVARTQEDAVARSNHPTTKRHVSKRVRSPVGTLTLVASDQGLAAILWEHDRPGRARLNIEAEDNRHPVLLEAERQLEEYFAGRRTRFTLPLDLSGTPFQQKVWRALLTIPFGETRSYAQIARQIGKPGAARAVGAANGRNPISIVAPCHRVIGATGALTGYGGGLDVKARLLALEEAGSTS
jgi:methylated-DNA-[protein]-cysteine S-methyltransferase